MTEAMEEDALPWEPDPARPAGPGRIGRGLGTAGAVAIGIAALLMGAMIYLWLDVAGDHSQAALRTSALEAAVTYGVNLSSYDYRNLTGPNSPWSQVETHAAPAIRKNFAAITSKLAPALVQQHGTAQGTVVARGLSSLRGNQAVVLLFVNQRLTSGVPKVVTSTGALRVEMLLLHAGGRWWIDNLEIVPA